MQFFAQAKARSLHKLDIFDGYLKPFVYKLGSNPRLRRHHQHIWIVDGFAGAGSYWPDDEGRIQDGSPLIAAKWARRIELDRGYDLVRCINVERDAGCHAELVRNLAPWQHLATALHGEFAGHLTTILETIGDDPALFFLDPFGVTGVQMNVIEQIVARRGKTELLLHFSDKTFLRMAGHLDERGDRVPVGRKVAESKLATLDAHVGTKRWRMLCPPGANTERAIDDVSDVYIDQLRKSGWRYAHQIRMRDRYSDRPAYRLMFATCSPHGVELMSDIVCRYEQSLLNEETAGVMTLWHDDAERQRLTGLSRRIFDAGITAGMASRDEIIHKLAPQLFGLYTSTEYARAIRELVQAGRIDRPSATGIEPREQLKFIEPPQTSLFA